MLNFEFLEKSLRIVSSPHFLNLLFLCFAKYGSFKTQICKLAISKLCSIQLGSIHTFCPLGYFWAWGY